jgi:predicted Zn-dependent protease
VKIGDRIVFWNRFCFRTKQPFHEIGHNLGLDHCTSNKHCQMNDARGHISQVDMETLDFCQSCKKKIGMGEK